MKIHQSSLLYRLAQLMRSDKAPPMKDACEVFANASLAVFGAICMCILAGAALLGIGFIGAVSLAALEVAEPASKTLALIMAVAAGSIPAATIVFTILGARSYCMKVKAEDLEGTLFYKFATFHVREDESVENLLDLLSQMACSLVLVLIPAGCAFVFICLFGLLVMAGFGIEDTPETGFGAIFKPFAYGLPAVFVGFAAFHGARWLCKRSTVELAEEA
jgi:hypothetical protein